MKKHIKPIITLLLVAALLVPTIGMIFSSAATSFTVELAFENLFVLDHWVINGNSMRVTNDVIAAGGPASDVGSVSNIDLENGSFRLTNKTSENVYTVASMGSGEYTKDNFDYYRMPVEEGVTYDLSYNITGNVPGFFPFIFFYDESNEYKTFVNGAANGTGDNTYRFTVPEGIKYIQIRLTLGGNSSKNAYADIKNIAIYKVDVTLNPNLFDFSTWSSKSGAGNGSFSLWSDGTVAPNSTTGSVTLTSNGGDSGSLTIGAPCSVLLTNMAYGAKYDDTNYVIDTEPGKQYVVSYELNGTMDSPEHVSFFPVWHGADQGYLSFDQLNASDKGPNSHIITAPANAYHFEVAFGLYDYSRTSGVYATISNISIKEVITETVIEHKVDPVRKTYTYTAGSNATYGTLPNPPAATYPENYIFAGWYTGKDGTGTRIAADTPILPQSYTVYPKFEPAVDSLTVAAMPSKTEYTVGEKLNTTGLVLSATINNTNGDEGTDTTFNVTSGYYCTPEYLTSTGTQAITVHYGGKTATFNVNVSGPKDKNITVNGATHAVEVANNNYTINYQAPSPFNRYEMTYFSDSYVKGEIVMDGITEVFFLEPSDNGSFASYIDSFLRGVNHYYVDSIKFTCLDKEFGNFELLSLTTIAATIPSNSTQYYENAETGYKVGIDLSFGGVVSEIYDLDDVVESRLYTIDGKEVIKVDYAERLNADYGTNYTLLQRENVNLINKYDRGRYLQQSYYGTSQKPYEMGDYNGNAWPYNPVQGGNLVINDANGNAIKGNEASKVIDYRITDDQIYIKTRPLDWGKNSVDYPDSYVTDSYMEAWYVFEDGMIKTYCRFVDYSGYPAHTRDQELPAVYIIEPFNNFVYNNVANGSEWTTTNYKNITEPDFWGVLPEYNALLQTPVDPTVDCYENWAAFTASDNAESFGVGVYSAGVTDFHYGCFFPKYQEEAAKNGQLVATENRHATRAYTSDGSIFPPAEQNPTSYISPVGQMTFESYKPIEYSYYLTTGKVGEIYNDFKTVANKDNQAEQDKSKIAVPETVYMTPANGASKIGQYYVNNIMDESLNNKVVTEAKRDAAMYLGLSIKDAKEFSVKITNITDPSNDIFLCNTSGSEISEGSRIHFNSSGTYKNDHEYGLRFSGAGLQPGEKATAKWEITVYKNDGTSEVFTAYTVMYAPGRTVGAVAEARQVDASQNEISSWITGANGVDHNKQAPLGSLHADKRNFGYFKADPLYNEKAPSGGSGETPNDYIIVGSTSDDYYVMQAATNGHDGSRAQSYLGLLTIDKSRYTNTNQIPNLEIGFDALRVGSWTKDSLTTYKAYYTLGTSEAFTATNLNATPSGWTQVINAKEYANSHTLPYRETFIPEYNVSDEIDGKYIHALNQGAALQTAIATRYSTAGTSVLISVTDKSGLRDLVLDGYTMVEDDEDFNRELKEAATVLGDPSATQSQIDEAKKELNDAMEELVDKFYALKYDNIFSAYEMSQFSESMKVVSDKGTATYKDGELTVTNDTITGGEAYTVYGSANHFYKVQLKPNTEYVFEYDVTTTESSQAFMFFYDANGSAGDIPTNMSVQTDGGAWSSKTEGSPWWGNYQHGAGSKHYAIKFTTGPNTTQASFRFGNTTNNPCESTFSNIKLVESNRYYEDVDYAKTEELYKEYSSYGALPVLTRTGYTFSGWVDADGKAVTGADIATNHKSIFSVWTEFTYTIIYNANGGTGSIANKTVRYSETVALDSGNSLSRTGYKLLGWSTDKNATSEQYTTGQTVSKLTNVNNGNVTFYAVWQISEVNVTFDNLIDFKAWNKSAGNGTVSNVTDTGFTITCNSGAGEATSTSPIFPVTAGKNYKIEADITGNAWDIYIFFYDSNTSSGTGIDFTDSGNRYAANGGGNKTQIFTAPAGATRAVIRVDSNNGGNVTTFNNIRVYEHDGIDINVKPANKTVYTDETFGELPVPTREGYTFLGWYDKDGTEITATTTVTHTSTVYLTSKWVINDTALVSDTVVVDFATPIDITPLANDTIYRSAEGTQTFLGIAADNASTPTDTVEGDYGTFTFSNNTVTYKPEKVVNGVEEIYYYTSLTVDGEETKIKNTITVAPASNVLYEENLFTATLTGLDWTRGTATTVNQTPSSENDVYGYDGNTSGYNQPLNYSNGSAYTVTVNGTDKRSKNMTFSFAGEGFDLISACGPNTGVLVVTLRNDKTGAIEKSYLVDTYYGDSNYGDSTNKTLYQVPVINETGLEHSDYTVQVIASWLPSMSGAYNSKVNSQAVDGMTVSTAAYEGNTELREALAEVGLEYVLDAETVDIVWFDEDSVLNGGKGANTVEEGMLETQAVTSLFNVIDSVRVYKPLSDGDTYYIPSERNAQYYNVVSNLVNGKEDGVIPGLDNFFAYVSGNNNAEITVDNYNSIGPKDELYLTNSGTGVAFTINGFNPDTTKVMISLRAASGTPTAKFGTISHIVNSNTEMYYDITSSIKDGTVTIQNTAPGTLLAVGSIKVTSTDDTFLFATTELDLATASFMMSAPATIVEPNTPNVEPDEPDEPTDPTEPTDPEDPTEPTDPTVPVEPDEPSDDNASECWLVRFINWVIEMVTKVFNVIKSVLGF